MKRAKKLNLIEGDNPFKLMVNGKDFGKVNLKINPDKSLSIVNTSLKRWVQ